MKFLSIPKLQRCKWWSLKIDQQFQPTLTGNVITYPIKLNYVSKRGHCDTFVIILCRLFLYIGDSSLLMDNLSKLVTCHRGSLHDCLISGSLSRYAHHCMRMAKGNVHRRIRDEAHMVRKLRCKWELIDGLHVRSETVVFNPRPVLDFGYCRCLRLCVCVCQSRACPRDNLSSVQVKTTILGLEVENTLVNIPIVWGVLDFDRQGEI